jgi:hypothetical protein
MESTTPTGNYTFNALNISSPATPPSKGGETLEITKYIINMIVHR